MTPEPFLAERFEPSVATLLQDTGLYGSYVYVDGYFLEGAAAAVSVWDHGFLYGDGVFEGIRAYGGRIFRLEEHLDRLYASAAAISLPVPLTASELTDAIRRTFQANQLESGHARPIVTRGPGRSGLDPRRAVRPSIIIETVGQPQAYGGEPISVCISTVRRRSSRSIDSRIKCLNYMDSVLARLEANVAGLDDAILLDLDGYVAEATAENVFLVRDGAISTPTTLSALPGITRALVIDHLVRQGATVQERNIEPDELAAADEMFLTGTAAEIIPVGSVDGRIIGSGRIGEITAAVAEWYRGHTVSYPGVPIM